MNWFRFLHRRRKDARLDEEIAAHIDAERTENLARGLTPEEAERQARIKFGNARRVHEDLWQQNSLASIEDPARDIRYAIRTLARTPGFTLTAVLVMALCIGASTSLFTVLRSVLLKPLPFREPDRLVMVYERYHMNQFPIEYSAVSPADYYDWRANTHGFADMAAWEGWSQFNLTGNRGELSEVVHAGAATANFFPLLGVPLALGRAFTDADDHWGADTVILTWSLFERRFAADPAILSKQIHLDARPYTVIGVLPRWFTFPDAEVQLWVPYQSITPPQHIHQHAWHQTRVIARLRPDVSLADAIGQIGAVQYRLHQQHLDQAVCEGAVSRTLNDDLARNVKKPLMLLLSAVACMLLIGCLNVANLLVARGAARQREVAIRGALGAQRWTLIRGQLAESLLISLAGGGLGVLLSLAVTHWMVRAWKDFPSAAEVRMDGGVLFFACALVFATTLLAGLLPAISSTGRAVQATLQVGSRAIGGSLSRSALRKAMLTLEIAVTVVLLVAAGLLLKNLLLLRTTNLRCATDNVLTMGYSLPKQKYDTAAKVISFHERLTDSVAALPGAEAVGLGETVPGAGAIEWDVFDIPEHPPQKAGDDQSVSLVRRADPGYFTALKIPLLEGRFFTRQDTSDQTHPDQGAKVIVNHEFARRYFPGEDPIGKHLQVRLWSESKFEIVGVVADTLHQVNEPVRPTFYTPALSNSDQDETLVVRTTGNPLLISLAVQKQIAALDPELPVSKVLTMRQIVGDSLGNLSLVATLVVVFAVLSLVLASVGLYGVLSYLMTQRTSELGIRIALGAQRAHILRLMLFDGLRPALLGLGLGILISVTAVRLLRSMLYGTRALDPSVLAAVSSTLLLVAILACILPAQRASRLDPAQALRAE